MAAPDPRTPVIVGVGVSSRDTEAVDMMVEAAGTAGEDSGAPDLLKKIGHIGVPGGLWAYSDPGRIVADRIGAKQARTSLVATGIPQQTLFNDVYKKILAGKLDVGLVVGGEAARRAALARRAGTQLTDTVQEGVTPDDLQLPKEEIVSQIEIESGMSTAMEPFAMVDSALRHAERRTLDEHRDEIARLWAGFSEVA